MKVITSCNIQEASLLPDGTIGLGITNIKYMDKINLAQQLIDLDLKVFYDRVIVVPDKEPEMTSGGIIIPDTAKEKPRKGLVIYVGPDCTGTRDEKKERLSQIRPGERVVYGKYAGAEMLLNKIEVNVMRESDIFFSWDPAKGDIEISFDVPNKN